MQKSLTLFQKILLSLIIIFLLIMVSDLLLQYFFDISLFCGELIIPLAVVGILSLYVFYSRKPLFMLVLFSIIISFVLIFANLTKGGATASRRAITASEYSIEVRPHSYSIIRYYAVAEKIVAVKKSDAFFNPDSKTGIDLGYQVKIRKETPDSLFIEINSGLHQTDGLKKSSLWQKSQINRVD
ncbi:MAG: hypothetical protein LBE92_06720 [Chryseobacterium sp.]|jgi:hypothetical protein|uniref:hypothetical protein n=1 Tax=Chryseobacterium sp. TaxID=1871047 RepID=UPI0028388FFB|nr:hypothetical protein [Chryseobacterium sp.]MDR2235799.1 hypothetical protein [Chryseobacterium sp.]